MGKEGEDVVRVPSAAVELETLILQKVEAVSSAIDSAKHVDEVISALHSLAIRLFPVDSSVISDAINPPFKSQVMAAEDSHDSEKDEWRHAFYHGAAFPAMSRMLLYSVSSNWLSCFPPPVRKQVYDSFFVEGPTTEVIQALVPALKQNGTVDKSMLHAIRSNAERLLVLCLLENEGVHHMVVEIARTYTSGEKDDELVKANISVNISRVAQVLASIPDKASLRATPLLSSCSFFRHIVIQLLDGLEQRALELYGSACDPTTHDWGLFFVGETFSRICRRGSADILVCEMISRILRFAQGCLTTKSECEIPSTCEKNPKAQLWSRIIEAIKDIHAVETLAEVMLRQLSAKNPSEVEAYWVLWLLFNRRFQREHTIRGIFLDKFLFWKVFPVCCLRWIIQFSIFEHPPSENACINFPKAKRFFGVVQRLVTVWCKREFVRSSRVEQQAYITAAVGLCLEKMTKEELETTEDVLQSILQGVTCRLESPIDLVRKMGSSIALAFSKVVDPANPLYLEDSCHEDMDWEFGLLSLTKEPRGANENKFNNIESKNLHRDADHSGLGKKLKKVKDGPRYNTTKVSEVTKIVVENAASPGSRQVNDNDSSDDESKNSEASSDSSLQPYDLSDDDMDLKKSFTQLADIIAALRKPDDSDGIDRALDVAEKLIRASPDELRHSSGDLVRALIFVRCSDIAVEGREDSAEERRQKALVTLTVTCPFESLDALTKLIYSPNVDIGQRILIIDVMIQAAQELSDATFTNVNGQARDLISSVSPSQPWFVPSNRGPPGAGAWKEVEEAGVLSWSQQYVRDLPSKNGQIKIGKSRRWSITKARESQSDHTKNKFPLYAAAFMLPVMQGYDKKRHGVDLLERDFIVLGKLVHMLGVCMQCMAMHPEASALASHLLDMLSSRELADHAEAYVRRSVLFAASSILVALHPSFVASSLIEGNQEISNGLEWIRTWALHVTESDPDTDCSTMAMGCLQLHSELALQTSRCLETAQTYRPKVSFLPPKVNNIIIPLPNR